MCARFRVFHAIETGWRSVATTPISRSVAAKPHNVKRCSLAAEVQVPENPCQLRGTNAHEVTYIEIRAQIFGNCGRHCHLEPHLILPCSYTQESPSARRSAVHRVFGVTGAGGNRTHDTWASLSENGNGQGAPETAVPLSNIPKSLNDAYRPSVSSVSGLRCLDHSFREETAQSSNTFQGILCELLRLSSRWEHLSATEAKFRNLLVGLDTRQAYYHRTFTRGVAWHQLADAPQKPVEHGKNIDEALVL